MKKFLALTLALVLCLGMLSTVAIAGGALEGPLISMKDKLFNTQEQTEFLSGEGWSYDPGTRILELNNYTGSITISESDVTLKLVGKNSASLMVNDLRDVRAPKYPVKITGDGSLSGSLYLQGGDVVIESGEYVFKGHKNGAIHIQSPGSLVIKGGKVTATATDGMGVVCSTDELSVQGGELIAQGGTAAIGCTKSSWMPQEDINEIYGTPGAELNPWHIALGDAIGGEGPQDALPLTWQAAQFFDANHGNKNFEGWVNIKEFSALSAGSLTMLDKDTAYGAAKYARISGAAGSSTPAQTEVPQFAEVPQFVANTAYQSTQPVELDGDVVELQAYALKEGSGMVNYVKLRDVAVLLDGTAAQFNVGWDGCVNIETNAAYTSWNGQENNTPYSGDRPYEDNPAVTRVNGQDTALDSFILRDDAGGASTYYKLRDLGQALGFNVGWSSDRGIYIETDKPYSAND